MGTISAAGMRALEDQAFAAGVSAEQLMDQAGAALGTAAHEWFAKPGSAVAFLGSGHNAGDALVALRVLLEHGWQIAARSATAPPDLAPLTRHKLSELGVDHLVARIDPLTLPRPLVLLDGLVGIGARGPLREPLAALAAEMNTLRARHGAFTVAVDLPSGIDPDTGEIHPGAVTADLTITIGVPKSGLLESRALNAVGRLRLVPLTELPVPEGGARRLITPHTLDARVEPRPFDFHKGLAGRVAVVAGSRGMTGAAILCGLGALRGGAGLVTLFAPPEVAAVLAAAAPPELMVRTAESAADIDSAAFDALVIGPGLGPAGGVDPLALLANAACPVVADADALNRLAAAGRHDLLGSRVVVTPHPGEFARLAPHLADLPREETARRFADTHPCTLLLKGARTLVTRAATPLWFNSTGHPGMATAGQGDMLAGVLGALLARGLDAVEAACLAAWLCGRAAERALRDRGQSQSSLTAGDTLACLGSAFSDWHAGRA